MSGATAAAAASAASAAPRSLRELGADADAWGSLHVVPLQVGDRQPWEVLVFLPAEYGSSEQPWPLIFFLHGGPESGGPPDFHPAGRAADVGLAHALPFDGRLPPLPVHDPPQGLERPPEMRREAGELGRSFPFVVATPHIPNHSPHRWHMNFLDRIAAQIQDSLRVDRARTYLTGFSRGGQGTWEWASASPHLFAAMAPVCGCWWCLPFDQTRAECADILSESGMPIWSFSAADDKVVPPGHARDMKRFVEAAGHTMKITELEQGGHFVDLQVYADRSLYDCARGSRHSGVCACVSLRSGCWSTERVPRCLYVCVCARVRLRS
eukprot:TRINITY_DN7196_c0_g1_i1.p1 TRINITY_DN7196_c0_g1~~TRINITY_DN7196_c0_g1_i1.p1  ORF type:complete len:357 (+),score=40.82 TRINITY_DN7196_c0_g1_i1:102-1073(+)